MPLACGREERGAGEERGERGEGRGERREGRARREGLRRCACPAAWPKSPDFAAFAPPGWRPRGGANPNPNPNPNPSPNPSPNPNQP